MTFFATASMLFLAFTRASFANGPFRTNMTIGRLSIILIDCLLGRFHDGSNLRSRFITFRLTRDSAILSSMMRRGRTDLIAIGRCPFTLTILTDRACAIDVQIKDRRSINVSFFYRLSNRYRYFYVFQIQECRYERIATLRRLFNCTVCIFGTPRLR